MKIVVFGASGGTGSLIVEKALAAGHQVTAFVRSPEKITLSHPNLTLFQGDVMDADKVDAAIQGQDAVISALGPTRPPVEGMMKTAAEQITRAMERHGVRRLISTTGAGVRDPQDKPGLMDRVFKALLGLISGAVLRDSEANVKVIRATDLDWTIVRFPMLTDDPGTGSYRVGYLGSTGPRLPRADGAAFIIKELEAPQYVRQMPAVSS